MYYSECVCEEDVVTPCYSIKYTLNIRCRHFECLLVDFSSDIAKIKICRFINEGFNSGFPSN